MGRRRKGQAISGWVNLDKAYDLGSTNAVSRVRWLFDAQKAGHAGTLDPLATGILPIALGEATKTVPYLVDADKAYRFTIAWGRTTTTLDREGEVVAVSDVRPTAAEIEAVLPRFVGEIDQVPPIYSAIKIDGERAYDLARDGQTVALESRPVMIDDLRVVDMPDEATTVFEAECGKGTYVRAIARDLGEALGCYGHVIALRRTRVGPFSEDEAVGKPAIEARLGDGAGPIDPNGLLLPVEAALDGLAAISVSSSDASRLVRGQGVILRGRDSPIFTGQFYAVCKGRIVAIGEADKGELRPLRVFNLGG